MPPEMAIFCRYYKKSICPLMYFDWTCKDFCFPPKKSVKRRNEKTIEDHHYPIFSSVDCIDCDKLSITFLIYSQFDY